MTKGDDGLGREGVVQIQHLRCLMVVEALHGVGDQAHVLSLQGHTHPRAVSIEAVGGCRVCPRRGGGADGHADGIGGRVASARKLEKYHRERRRNRYDTFRSRPLAGAARNSHR